MDRNIIAFFIDLIHCLCMVDAAGQSPCRVHGHIWIIAVYFHPQVYGRVRDQHADRTKTDHTELLALDLCPGKSLFLFLCDLGDIAVFFIFLHPVDAADDIAGSQKHPRDHQLFYSICICARSIEDHDPVFRAAVQRDIVDPGSRARDHFQVLRELHLMHLRASDEDGIRLLCVLCVYIIFIQLIQSHFGDRIQAVIFEHFTDSPLQTSS